MGTKVINAGGKLVLPGFVDCHIHFMEGSAKLEWVRLEDAKSLSEIRFKLRSYAAQNPGEGWILGHGWNYGMFGPGKLPDKQDLDDIFPNRAVSLEGFDGHTYWVNSKALALAGITRDTPNPPNGTIVRDPATGGSHRRSKRIGYRSGRPRATHDEPRGKTPGPARGNEMGQ